jgi:DNA-binding transcriptional LysR family regulator
MVSGFSCDLVRDVLAGKVDLAFATEPPASPMLSMMKVSEAPFYVAMSEHNELASHRALNVCHLDEKSWVLFGRGVHPPLYDSMMRVAEGHKVRPRDLHHILMPEEAFELIAERNGLALLTKTGALRIARDGVTLRPLIEEQLTLKTYLASRGDNTSKAVSEMVRAFGRKIKLMNGESQLRLPISA